MFQIDGNIFFDGVKKDVSCKVNNFDLNTINKFTNSISIALGGVANGYFVYKNAGQRQVVLTNLSKRLLQFGLQNIYSENRRH